MAQVGSLLNDARRLLRSGRARDALPMLEQAVAAETRVGPAHALHLEALITLGLRREALAAHERALSLETPTADALDALAFFARQLDRHERSNALYRRATELAPNDPQLWYNLATSERTLGRLREAASACDQALRLAPDMRAALLLRSEVVRATRSSNHVNELKRRLSDGGERPDAMFIHYALGKELHELGDYDEAFRAFARGAAARRRALRYDVAQDEQKLRRIAEVYSTGAVRDRGAPIGRHIFIVGLPRSGTTLTERILGGLEGVTSNGETNNFSTALFQAAPETGGDPFERAAKAPPALVAQGYEALAAGDGFAAVVEKLPLNYLYVGAILQAFPNTPIVWVRRNPLDSCFAMFRTLFAAACPFSYDFEDLARYYAAYQGLMAHWERLFPGQLIAIDYEDLVAAPDQVGRRLAARCGLPWTEEALDLSRNRSASLTASAAQVRGEIYSTSSGAWRNYRSHLSPLARALASRGVEVDNPR